MTFEELLAQVVVLLQRQGWASYQTLRRRFQVDEATLRQLQQILLATYPVAVDDTGSRFVWTAPLQPVAVLEGTPAPVPSVSPRMPSAPSALVSAPQPICESDTSRVASGVIGREPEVALLRARWAPVQAGQGQVLLLRGEAGIGKSHLVRAVQAHVAGAPHVRWECRCDPSAQQSPLYPLIDLWQRGLHYAPEDTPVVRLTKLEAALAPYAVSLSEVVPLLASLLSVPLDGRYPALTLSPERQKQQTLAAMLRLLQAVAAQQPVLFILEDLHWADPSTLEFLTLLVREVASLRCYLLLTQRPEFQAPWPPPAHGTTLTLQRLRPAQVVELATQVAGGKALPADLLTQIVTRTEGVPLFVKDMTQMLLTADVLREAGDTYTLRGPLPAVALPATVQESLRARLEALGPAAATVAQVAAVWGRAVTEAQLQATVPLARADLERALARLVTADIVQEISLPPRLTYVFRHALLQEAAYAAMPPERRQTYHGWVAQVLAERFPDLAETQPEVLAQHYTEAGLYEPAILYWQRAGRQAAQRSAHPEAMAHCTKGLALLQTLPHAPAYARHELTLQIALGASLLVTEGYTSVAVEQTYARARTLCQQVGEVSQLSRVLFALCGVYMSRAEHNRARQLGEQFLELVQPLHNPSALLMAHHTLGGSLCFLGELALARHHLEHALALEAHQPQAHSVEAMPRVPRVVNSTYAAWTLWLLGYPEQARQRSHQTLTLAHELSHRYGQAVALFYAGKCHMFRRDGPAAQACAETAIALATEHGFAFWTEGGSIVRGWSLAAQGQTAAGIAQMRQGVAAWRARGIGGSMTTSLVMLAEVCGHAGHRDEAYALLQEAQGLVDNKGERYWEAELYRVRGELLLPPAVAAAPPAESCFRQALDIARRQQAKSLELRAAMSLSRLWQHQGKRVEAQALLAEVYGWFTEGFDTVDLQEARALLEALA